MTPSTRLNRTVAIAGATVIAVAGGAVGAALYATTQNDTERR